MSRAGAVTCPACGAGGLVEVADLGQVPVTSCRLVTRAEALALPRGSLVLGRCPSCGLVLNAAFDEERVPYDAAYEETQACSPAFRAFASDLAGRWVRDHDLAGATVVEVGCGKGEFAALLASAGVARVVGVDPAAARDRVPEPSRGTVEVLAERYGPQHAALRPAAVVARHLLEHVAEPAGLLRTVRAGLPEGGWLLLEVPDGARVLREGAFEDVYYEHATYWTRAALLRLLAITGFGDAAVESAYDGQYLLVSARAGSVRPVPSGDDETAALAERFVAAYDAAVVRWQERLAGRRAAVWGGGSKAVAFLTTLGAGDRVSVVVDVNPRKQGLAVPGTGHPVVAPEALLEDPPDLVVLMNPVYRAEVREELDGLGLQAVPLVALGD